MARRERYIKQIPRVPTICLSGGVDVRGTVRRRPAANHAQCLQALRKRAVLDGMRAKPHAVCFFRGVKPALPGTLLNPDNTPCADQIQAAGTSMPLQSGD